MIETARPLALASIAAVCFAASQVTVKRGLVGTSIVAGVLISLTTAMVTVGATVALDPPHSIDPQGSLLFAMAGLAAPGISRWAATTGIYRLGPSISVPITQATRPVLAVTGALLFLGEELSALRAVGLVGILAGGWELSRSREDARTMSMGALEGEVESAPTPPRFRPGIIFPLLAGAAYASADLVVKSALSHQSHPRFGALVGMAAALIAWGVAMILVPSVRRRIKVSNDAGWFVLSGVLAGLATISLYTALEAGQVTLVSPISATQPLAVFVLSRLLLPSFERLHLATLLAGTAVVLGTILIST